MFVRCRWSLPYGSRSIGIFFYSIVDHSALFEGLSPVRYLGGVLRSRQVKREFRGGANCRK